MPDRRFARWLDQTNDVTATFLAAGAVPGLINLGGGLPDAGTWPVAQLEALAAEAVRDHTQEALGYGPVKGLPRLRDIIATRMSKGNLRLTRDNVLITTGGSQALAALGAALLEPGDKIAVQAPTYLGALDCWRARAPQYVPMQLENDGFDPRGAMAEAQFAYTVPNFSNPSGRLVGLDQRRELLSAAQETGCWLVEDDPYGTLYFDGTPLPLILEIAGETPGPVIYMGTVSKTLAPGLRVGWAIAEPDMIDAMASAKQGMDMFSSGLCQVVAARALEDGLDITALPEVLESYRARRDALCSALATHLSDDFAWQVPEGGMFVWVRARHGALDTDALMRAGLEEGVCISPSSVFDPDGQNRAAMRLNFTFNAPDKLAEGIARLARAHRRMLRAAA